MLHILWLILESVIFVAFVIVVVYLAVAVVSGLINLIHGRVSRRGDR